MTIWLWLFGVAVIYGLLIFAGHRWYEYRRRHGLLD